MLINIIRVFTYPLRHLYGGGRPGCCPRDNSAIVSYLPALKSSQTHGVRLKEEFLKNKVMQSYPTVKKHFSATGNVRDIRGPMYILIIYAREIALNHAIHLSLATKNIVYCI